MNSNVGKAESSYVSIEASGVQFWGNKVISPPTTIPTDQFSGHFLIVSGMKSLLLWTLYRRYGNVQRYYQDNNHLLICSVFHSESFKKILPITTFIAISYNTALLFIKRFFVENKWGMTLSEKAQ